MAINRGIENKEFVLSVCARLGVTMTEEQVEFASDFTKPTISFSDPGTGKSFSTVIGLIVAQTLHQIPGRNINTMSFTRAATAELKQRYCDVCKVHNMTPTVQFNTFHSICYAVVKEAYPNMKIKENVNFEKDLPILLSYIERHGLRGKDMFYARSVLETMNALNSALVFDKLNVERSYQFKRLEMDIELFQDLRVEWFLLELGVNCITRGDIPIYALYVLCRYPEIKKKYREQYKIMVVDEFQDLSLLHLKILSMVTYNLVAIGDMKQQIYAFNGASPQIVEEYLKIYPDARIVNLTHSFRCKNEVAEFATRIVRKNNPAIKAFIGVSDGAEIQIMPSHELNLPNIVEQLKKQQSSLDEEKQKDSMFLFRNNVSAIPLAEALYKQNVRFRMPRFLPIYEMPIFNEICALINAVRYPLDKEVVFRALKVFPEFKRFSIQKNPVLLAMEQSGLSLLDVPYKYQEESSAAILEAMERAFCILKTSSAGRVFNCMLPVYERYIIQGNWWKLPKEKEFYFELIAPIVNSKSYIQMYEEEVDKTRFIKESIDAGYGVRCYTIHVAKGLEADNVYILDADEGIFPNSSTMQKYVDAGCEYEAAKELRNERNLLYVAVTRAKNSVTICYKTELTQLLSNPLDNDYCVLDRIYDETKKNFDDVGEFIKLFHLVEEKLIEPSKAIQETEPFDLLEVL